jgi:hypothetical protein
MVKKRIFSFFLLLPALFYLGCTENDDYQIQQHSVSRIDSIWVTQSSVICSVLVWTPDPCYDFDHHTLKKEGNQYLISIYTRYDGSAICPCVVWSVSPRITIPKPVPGDYLFSFWQSDSTSLDTLIKIN